MSYKERNHQIIQSAVNLCKWFNQTEVAEELLSYWMETEIPKLKLDKLKLTKAKEVVKGRILKDYGEIFEEHIEQFLSHGKITNNIYKCPN